MARPRRRARRQASKRLAPFYRMTFIILIGAVAARLIILGIDALGARTGLPGGEIFIPVYIIIAPLFGWQLRGWTAIGGHQRRKETRPCTTISATTAERPSTPGEICDCKHPEKDDQRMTRTYNGKEVYTADTFDYATAKVGDYVEQAVVDDAMNCLPPACMTSACS